MDHTYYIGQNLIKSKQRKNHHNYVSSIPNSRTLIHLSTKRYNMHVKPVKQHGKILTKPPEIWSKPPDQSIKPVNYSLFKIGKKS